MSLKVSTKNRSPKNFCNDERRNLLKLLTISPLFSLFSCSALGLNKSMDRILDEPLNNLTPILKPIKIQKSVATPTFVIDVHAHFFNARDVPIKGYIEGPVAHSKGGIIGRLLKALAPIAEWIGNKAPSASEEIAELIDMAKIPTTKSMSSKNIQEVLNSKRETYIQDLSIQLYEQLKQLPEFMSLYNSAQAENRAYYKAMGLTAPALNEMSLQQAMQMDMQQRAPTLQSFTPNDPPPYADGVLAFIGYMMSHRWMNLIAYQRVFSTNPAAFGVDQVLGALVDFDHWLTPPPRTSHADQIKLHQLLSQLSGGYMRPLVSYNPWSDVLDNGNTLARALDAIDRRGFVGVKIYPPNGFRPLGNSLSPAIPPKQGRPTAAELDNALLKLWTECGKRNVPVMAHSGNSMGSDNAHNSTAGPIGWKSLIDTFGSGNPIRANLGHFGGDSIRDDWNLKLAQMMSSPEGAALYGDLGYWDSLRCNKGLASCAARIKLSKSIQDFPVVADRLMYGSDWLMLSQERRWDRFPADVLAALPSSLNTDAIFGANANRCFPNLLRPT